MHFEIKLLYFLENRVFYDYWTSDVPRGKLKWSVHPNHSSNLPLTPGGVWQGFELSPAGTSAASPVQWNWMGFRLHLAVFIRSYFLWKIKIVKTDQIFCSSVHFRAFTPKSFIGLTDLLCTKAFFNGSSLLSCSRLHCAKPRIHGCHQNPVVMWLFFASLGLSTCPRTGRVMWACAFLNKPETLSPEMELWLCGYTDWVVGGRRMYVYCKLRQMLSSPV